MLVMVYAMENRDTSSSQDTAGIEDVYFDLQASWGITKHLGGSEATIEIAERCNVTAESKVLIVGCGVGITPCFMVKKYGCQVVGVDISEKMVRKSKHRADKQGVGDKTEFRVADAQILPFRDEMFDAVFCESVLAFVPDKQKAVRDFARVTASNGYTGFNEVTWLAEPPVEIVEYMTRIMGSKFFMAEEWKALLENTGLADISAQTYSSNVWKQWASEVRQFETADFLTAWGKYFIQIFTNPATRSFTVEAMKFPRSIFGLFRYFGYGIYVGKKQ